MVTPLARQVINQLMLKPEQRTMYDPARVMKRMDDIHCFEVTEVINEVEVIIEKSGIKGAVAMAEATCFLPAQKTWIEWSVEMGRIGVLLEETENKTLANVTLVVMNKDGVTSLPEKFAIPLVGSDMIGTVNVEKGMSADKSETCGKIAVSLVGILAFINTPKIIGQRQHMPHRGLEKKLLKDRKNIGIFPLHAWKEILLRITPPKDMSGKDSKEAHLTGQKALHFCRAHLRIMYGKLVVVRGHWRGDASLGIEQRKYKLVR